MKNKIKEIFLTKQFLSFLIIGISNTLSSQLLYMLFVLLEISPALSSILSDVLTIILSYFLNMIFTYKMRPTIKTFIKFPASYIPGTIINAIMVLICTKFLNVPNIFAKIAAAPITVPINYLTMNFVIKGKNKNKL